MAGGGLPEAVRQNFSHLDALAALRVLPLPSCLDLGSLDGIRNINHPAWYVKVPGAALIMYEARTVDHKYQTENKKHAIAHITRTCRLFPLLLALESGEFARPTWLSRNVNQATTPQSLGLEVPDRN